MSEEIKDRESLEAATSAQEDVDGESRFKPVYAPDEPESDDVDEAVVIHDADAEDALEEAALRHALGQNTRTQVPEDQDAPNSEISMSE
jgi:hypothetical protein